MSALIDCSGCAGVGVADCVICEGYGVMVVRTSVRNVVTGSVTGSLIQTSGDVTAPIVFGGAA
ncbi:hypothetical protein [Actinoalloteichus sp. GBA129-24]|uniref:hypothetical protein n=1 Tax=Actinoalloteichus sp. GBA129-24 TaxID=1612551 RepID=UPI000950416F|nr:hypothetical protein [Actinoalloteichus sp. GBA129-24]APU20130.1 hypothetical protein UA75_10585 [Actinoalloteichus sp. GBA129-24]